MLGACDPQELQERVFAGTERVPSILLCITQLCAPIEFTTFALFSVIYSL